MRSPGEAEAGCSAADNIYALPKIARVGRARGLPLQATQFGWPFNFAAQAPCQVTWVAKLNDGTFAKKTRQDKKTSVTILYHSPPLKNVLWYRFLLLGRSKSIP